MGGAYFVRHVGVEKSQLQNILEVIESQSAAEDDRRGIGPPYLICLLSLAGGCRVNVTRSVEVVLTNTGVETCEALWMLL